jgi:LuxR family transcriptional regulator, maltose regulon positive regulatory protein
MSSTNRPEFTILNAKLNRPRVTKDLIVRPRLLALLDAALAGPLSIVVAPAGFGKTTLVSSWIEELDAGKRQDLSALPAAWLTLDESDSNINVLLNYFISALRKIFPGAAPKTMELVTARQQPPSSFLAGTLSNEIEALSSSFVMVLDETHLLHDQDVFDFLTAWLRYWPRPLHLVLLSRRNPPLPLTKLRAKGKLTEIRSRDLRFTADETAEYLSRTLGSPLKVHCARDLTPANGRLDYGFEAGHAVTRSGGQSRCFCRKV